MTASQENPLRDRPTGELLKELSDHTTTLVKQELDLAKAELHGEGQAGRHGRRDVRRRRSVRRRRVRRR